MADKTIGPQPGPQTKFLQCDADIVIFGGARGGGKSHSLLMDAMRYCIDNQFRNADGEIETRPAVKGYNALLLRKSYKQIEKAGGLLSASEKIYPYLGAKFTKGSMRWTFPSEAMVEFGHMEHEQDKDKYLGLEIPWIGFDEVNQFCLTPDHEVLTLAGWKPIVDVTTEDSVYAKMLDGSGEFRKVTDTHRYSIDDEIVEVHQRNGVSFKCTKNHRVLVQRQDENRSLGFVTAEHLCEKVQTIPRAASLTRSCKGGGVNLPIPSGRGIGRNANIAREPIPLDIYLEFLGWYISEGCSVLKNKSQGGTSPCVCIRQTKPSESLKSLMGRLPWRVVSDRDGGYMIFSRQLYDHLEPLGTQYTKRIPRWILEECSEREMRIFWEAFVDGDGYRPKGGGVQIGLCNEGLRDDLHEMATLLGHVATAGHSLMRGQYDAYTLNVSKRRVNTQVKSGACEKVQYQGDVYCLSVDCPEFPDFSNGGYYKPPVHGGNFLIRRNGRCCFTGNSESMFWFMTSSNRSTLGVPSRIRATCNPDSASWVAKFIEWWIDQETGWPIPERDGVIRWFVRLENIIHWADSKDELWENVREFYNDNKTLFMPSSATFIKSLLEDNKILEDSDPGYRAKLMQLPEVERQRFLEGNWLVSPSEGSEWADHPEYFDKSIWTDKWPDGFVSSAIFIDPSKGKTTRSDFSAIVFVGLHSDGKLYVHSDIKRRPAEDIVRDAMRMYNEFLPNMMGIEENNFQDLLAPIFDQECEKQGLPPFEIFMVRAIEKKEARIRSLGPLLDRQKIKLHKSKNNNRLLYQQLKDFGIKGTHDDGPDALEGAIRVLRALGTDPIEDEVDQPEDWDDEPEVEYAL